MQVVKQPSTGQSWLPDWTREVSAKVNYYQSGRLCLGGRVNQAAIKIWGRDLQEPVSSLSFGDGRGSITRFVLLPGLSRWQGKGVDGADEQDYYLCPWSILHKEGGGRSWVINNTSNLPGVDLNKQSK